MSVLLSCESAHHFPSTIPPTTPILLGSFYFSENFSTSNSYKTNFSFLHPCLHLLTRSSTHLTNHHPYEPFFLGKLEGVPTQGPAPSWHIPGVWCPIAESGSAYSLFPDHKTISDMIKNHDTMIFIHFNTVCLYVIRLLYGIWFA